MKESVARPNRSAASAPLAHRASGARVRLTRYVMHRLLCRLTRHTPVAFQITYWDGTDEQYGSGVPAFHLGVADPAAVWRVLRAPDPALGDAYVAGAVEVDDLERLLDLLFTSQVPHPIRPTVPAWMRRGTPVSRQYQDIQAHYDRGDAFFSLWLDASRTYSCAYFRTEADDLETAQAAKIQRILAKAQLRPGDTLLDIGSGWGALVLQAARAYGARATGITLSRQQYEFSRAAIRASGLQDRTNVELLDYRELAAQGVSYDRVVSVGMLEHVGRRNLPVFMQAVRRLLKPGGVCVLHTITQAREIETGPWMRRHIFPGGYIPSWRQVIALLPEHGFHLIDVESLRRHYHLTLTHWAHRFEQKLPEVRELGFDESFIRMWRLYLRACAAAFRWGSTDLHQFVFTHGINNSLSLTREHL
jgi:cyclopropane-fatty-acyl-phospholipid synthase